MALLACGINYKTADLNLRERLAITPEKLSSTLNNLIQYNEIQEAVILSTCNRTEIYCEGNRNLELLDWLSHYHQIPANQLHPHYYQYHDQAAFKHALRVASGLDSMVIGEPEILGQMKNAIAQAEQIGTLGSRLRQIFSAVFSASKQVRRQTDIGASSLSIATTAINLANRIFADLSHCKVLCIGAGETIELVAKHLVKQPIAQLFIANRTASRAQFLANKFAATILPLNKLNDYIFQADIVIAATLSPLPIVGKGLVERALKMRKHKPILMIDLGIPRDIENEIAQLNGIYLYTLDDLQKYIHENTAKRHQAAQKAEDIIDLQTAHFMQLQRVTSAAPVIRSYREKMQQMSNIELAKAIKRLENGENPQQIMQEFSHTLINKFLHQPTIQLRQAAMQSEYDLLNMAQKLFDIG